MTPKRSRQFDDVEPAPDKELPRTRNEFSPQPAESESLQATTPRAKDAPQSPAQNMPVVPPLNFDDPQVRFQLRGIAGTAASSKASILDRMKNKRHFVGFDDRVDTYRVIGIDAHEQTVKLRGPKMEEVNLEKAD